MKRMLLSIGIALLLLIVYLTITSIVVVLSGYDREMILFVQIPVSLPQIVYYYFSPPLAEDYQIEMTQRKAIVATLLFLANILLYSIPVYILLSLISRFRKRRREQTAEPPPPPAFD